MKLTRFKRHRLGVVGVMHDDNGGTYFTLENPEKMIPEGEYRVVMTHSPKFGRDMPLVFSASVAAARGIRIHSGNTVGDTNGCILVGNRCDLTEMRLYNSTVAMVQVWKAVADAEFRALQIVNDFQEGA